MVLLIICKASGHGRLPAGLEHAQGLDHPVAALRGDGAPAREGGVRRVLGIQVVGLAALAAIVRVRRRDLEHLDAGVLQVAQQPRAVGARRLDADALEQSEGAHPGEHLLVAVPGRREAPTCQHPVTLVDNGRDVQVLVRVHAADDAAVLLSIPFHAALLVRRRADGSTGPSAWTGQSCDRTSGPSWVTCTGEAEPRRKASWAADRSEEGHGVVDQSVGQTAPRRLAAPATLAGRSL
jgi:hypothetical protein